MNDLERKLDGLYEAYDQFSVMQDYDEMNRINKQIEKIKELMEKKGNE